jgi:ABC-type multidrug transport system permease subunit
MKKIIFFGFMFFIIFSQLFADENINEYKNVTFAWQLFYLKNTNQEIKFLNLNPLFYSFGNDVFLMKLYENDARNSISQRSQNINSQNNNDIYGFIGSLFLFSGYTYFSLSMNRQEREIINNAWERHQNEEQMRQTLLGHNNRN